MGNEPETGDQGAGEVEGPEVGGETADGAAGGAGPERVESEATDDQEDNDDGRDDPTPTVRYLMLPELHRSGAIHYHGLLHHGGDITYRMVRDSWTAGYSYPSAVRSPEKTAKYVTKYCTKDLLGGGVDSTGRSRRPRIMASRAPTYGDPVILRDADLVQAVQATHAKDLTEIWETNLRQSEKC